MQPGLCLDPAQPLDRSHPSNRDLVSEWANLPAGQWGRGTLWRDLNRGSCNDGTLSGGPTWAGRGTAGAWGAVNFAGSAQNVVLPNSAALKPSRSFTVWAWFTSTAVNNYPGLYSAATAVGNNGFLIGYKAAGRTWGVTRPSLAAILYTTASLSDNTWYFGAVTVDGAATANVAVTVYSETALVEAATGTTTEALTTNTGAPTIGRDTQGGASGYWKGNVAQLGLHARTLSAAEIQSLWQETLAGNPERWRWVRPAKRWSLPGPAAASGNRRRRILMLTE